jgi:hypothetical protein
MSRQARRHHRQARQYWRKLCRRSARTRAEVQELVSEIEAAKINEVTKVAV